MKNPSKVQIDAYCENDPRSVSAMLRRTRKALRELRLARTTEQSRPH